MTTCDIFCGGISGWFIFAVFMAKMFVVVVIIANRKKARAIVDCRDVEASASCFFWLKGAGKVDGSEKEFIHAIPHDTPTTPRYNNNAPPQSSFPCHGDDAGERDI